MMPGMPPPGMGAPQPPAKANPEEMKQSLVQVLQEVQRVAEENGINFQELVAAIGRGPSKGSVPPPPV